MASHLLIAAPKMKPCRRLSRLKKLCSTQIPGAQSRNLFRETCNRTKTEFVSLSQLFTSVALGVYCPADATCASPWPAAGSCEVTLIGPASTEHWAGSQGRWCCAARSPTQCYWRRQIPPVPALTLPTASSRR